MPWQSVNRANEWGANLWFEDRGVGTPLVLLHGFPLDGRIWASQLQDLSKIARVIVPDFRGFGQSTNPDSFTIKSLAEDLHTLLHQLHVPPCVLGGLSMGGYVSLAFAEKYPNHLRGLILVDTRAGADNPEAKLGRSNMIEMVRAGGAAAVADVMLPKVLAPGASSEVVDRVRAIMLDCPPLTIEHALAAMRDRADYNGLLAELSMPVRVIVGEQDAASPPAVAEDMVRRIKGGKLTVIPEAGHLAPVERPEAVSRAIEDFLREFP